MIIDGSNTYSDISATLPVSRDVNYPTSGVPANNTGATTAAVLAGPPLPLNSLARNTDAISQFYEWDQLAYIQSQLSDIQTAEASLADVYRQLSSLLQNLATSNTSQQANQLQSWYNRFKNGSGLDNELTPYALSEDAPQISYTTDKLNLLVTRPKDETITFYFRDTRSSVSVLLPADATPDELLDKLQQGLSREGISLSINNKAELVFSIAADLSSKLARPVSVSGDGYRIPAGNPVAVRLQQAPGIFDLLMNQLLTLQPANSDAYRNEVDRLRRKLRFSLLQLRRRRQTLFSALNDQPLLAGEELSDAAINDIQLIIMDYLGSDSYRSNAQLLSAQANLSRKNVIALLLG